MGRFFNILLSEVVSMASHPFSECVSGGLQMGLIGVGIEDDSRM